MDYRSLNEDELDDVSGGLSDMMRAVIAVATGEKRGDPIPKLPDDPVLVAICPICTFF
jgi:hypothetical protein